MKKFLTSFISLGVQPHYDNTLIRCIKITNFSSLTISLLIGLPLYIISSIEAPALTPVPAGIIVGVLLTPLLNYFGLQYFARLWCAVVLITGTNLYQALLVPAGQEGLISLMWLQLGVGFSIFLYFRTSEWKQMLGCGLYVVLLMIFYQQLIDWIELPQRLSSIFLRDTTYAYYTVLGLAIFISYSTAVVLIYMYELESRKNHQLITHLNKQQQKLKNSREELYENFTKINEAQRREKHQSWIAENLNLLNQKLRAKEDIESISGLLVRELAYVLKASQAGFFMVDEANHLLELKSSYGYSRAIQQYQFSLTDGPLGQAYLEKDSLYFTDIPDNHFPIVSGLGSSAPISMLIIPVMFNNKVLGLLQLATFYELENYQKEMVEKVTELAANYIHHQQANFQTRELLNDVQQNIEINQNQKEELHQNMEELNSIQEDMKRKAREYKKTINKLQEAIRQLDSSPH